MQCDSDEEVVGYQSLGARIKSNVRMGFEEINMLAELHLVSFDYVHVMEMVGNCVGTLLGISLDACQYDFFASPIDLPISIRVKLGIARLFLDEPIVADKHFQYLYKENPVECAELFFDVAEAFIQNGKYAMALNVFHFLTFSHEVLHKFHTRQISMYCGLEWLIVIP